MTNIIPPYITILLPFLTGILWIFSSRLSSKIKSRLSLFTLITAMIAGFSLFYADTAAVFSLNWQPQAGEMSLVLERSSLILVLLAEIAFTIVWVMRKKQMRASSPSQIGLAFISLTAVSIALTTNHFLMRFAALEFTGLCVVGTMLINSQGKKPDWNKVRNIFLNFRVGDLALLAAILAMQVESGTFLISQNLTAAQEASVPIQIITTAGLMTAVWVKLSLWPLGWWAEAASHLPDFLHIWYVDILLPILGAYLLYRTSPLLQVIHHFPDWIITLGMLAALARLFLTNLNQQKLAHTHLVSIFSTICLVILAIGSEQNVVWAFMIYWLIARMIFSFYTLKHEHSPPLQTSKSSIIFNTSTYFLHIFSLFALIQISLINKSHLLFSIVLWTIWWLITIRYVKLPITKKNKVSVNYVLSGMLAAGLATGILSLGIHFLTFTIKGHAIWILNFSFTFMDLLEYLLAGLISAFILDKFLGPQIGKTRDAILEFFQSLRLNRLAPGQSQAIEYLDPLDQTVHIFSVFQSAASFVYKTFEQNGIQRIASLLQKLFTFLFNQIERLTSVEIWKSTLKTIIDASRGMQRWHAGLLRINLFWFLLFIFILMFILFNQNPVFINPTG